MKYYSQLLSYGARKNCSLKVIQLQVLTSSKVQVKQKKKKKKKKKNRGY